MKAPAFWQQRPPTIAARLLQPAGSAYGAATLRRMRADGTKAGVPIICIGNFTAGGAGKTPTALAIAQRLQQAGRRPVFLSRGYGGAQAGPALVDPAMHGAGDVGDEPLLLARIAPTIVARDRVAGATLAAAHGDVIVMDDGLQNPSLAKDFTIAVVDGGAGIGNGLCIPAGPLRAPAAAQAMFADALLVIGLGPGVSDAAAIGTAAGRPVYRSDVVVDAGAAERLAGQRVLAFAGVGRPQKFFETLHGQYAKLESVRAFPDHHAFTDAEAAELLTIAKARDLLLVTTEKDHIRLKGSPQKDALAQASLAVPIRLALPDGLAQQALAAIARFPAAGA